MKLEVGQFVRYKNGIGKIVGKYVKGVLIDKGIAGYFRTENEDILKASNNIIDLIEEEDYVNELPVEDYYTRYDEEKDDYIKIGIVTLEDYWKGTFTSVEDIKSIVTKETFESMKYKLGDK